MENKKKLLEQVQKMIDESQESLTNCESTNDRKNEAQVLKELYAAQKGIMELIEEEKKNEAELKLKQDEFQEKRTADQYARDMEHQKMFLEEERLRFEKDTAEFEKKMRKYDTIIKVGTTAVGVGLCFGCWGVAAVTANDGVYDASIARTIGMLPQKVVEGFVRR